MLLRIIYILSVLSTLLFTAELSDSKSNKALTFCDGASNNERFIIVSTLDGKLTALNADSGGEIVWSITPGDAPMLSSSVHRLELFTSFGNPFRMIPSLHGGLYRFNGNTLDAVSVSVDDLLQASFRYSDGLVLSGGKERLTVGVSLRTGQVIYECSMRSGCREEEGPLSGDVLVVQRQGQVVHGFDPRSGHEHWNFSVASHDLQLLSECHRKDTDLAPLNMKVVIPEGLVCAVDSQKPSLVEWKHKFDSPVVSAWEISNGQLQEIDLFSTATQIGGETPDIYIGMYEKQLYIQESVTILKKRAELSTKLGQNLLAANDQLPQLPWVPIEASAENAGLIESDEKTAVGEVQSTGLSVLNDLPLKNGQGFYLYTERAVKKEEEEICNVTIPENSTEWDEKKEEETPVIVVIGSLWYWWKEVSIISITTALIFNLVFTRGYFRFRNSTVCSLEQPPSRSDSGVVVEELPRSRAASESDFVSRYLTDFDPVLCLGRGGFGVVFEAVNKIDDCHYAIKRITLPEAASSRERVLREVRALAKLDHQNIVRYFNSWLESPPPGWENDQKMPPLSYGDSESVVESAALSPSEASSVSKILCNGAVRLKDCEPSDSFIVFASESQNDHAILLESEGTEKESESGVTNSTETSICARSRSQTSASEWCKGRGKVYLYIQMQLCQRKSLRDWLRENQTRDYNQVLNIFEQIVMAVEYVHLRNLIHRDLKPSNIFFSLDHQIKIGDFGLVATMEDEVRGGPAASEKGDGHTAQVGTQLYMSPEQLAGKPYNYKVDIFSLGMILFELLVPFATEMERLRVLQDVKKHRFPNKFMEKHKNEHDLLQVMLSHSPDARPTTVAVRSRPPLLRELSGESVTT